MLRNKKSSGNSEILSAPENAKDQKKLTRTFVMIGLLLGMLMSAMNQTIVGTSIPKIVGELGGMGIYSWLFTAYILGEIITILIAGKMSDRLGRRPVFLAGTIVFLAGTILATTAGSMEMLIFCMLVQGLGSGVIMPVAMTTVADMYPPTEIGKMQGIMGAVFAVASVVGPFLGGFIVDNAGWRYVFLVAVPLGILSVILTVTKFPKLLKQDTPQRIDFLGMASLSTSLVALLLFLTWGGTTYAWDSIEILGLIALSVMAIIVFIITERRVEDPVLPLRLFKDPIFSLGCMGLLIMGLGLFGVISFLPMFQQAVIGMSASSSGATLIPLMIGLMVTIIISGFLVRRTGYKIWLIVGPPVAALGLFLLSTLNTSSSQTEAIVYTFIIGLGLGMTLSNYLVAAQNVANKKDMGVVTGSLTLFRSLGQAIGIALLGSMVNRQMEVELGNNLPAGVASILPSTDVNTLGGILLNPVASANIPTDILDAIRLSLSNSMTYMFLIAAIIVLCAVVASVFIKSVPLKDDEEFNGKEPEARPLTSVYKRILIPNDGSVYGRSAVEHALEIAKQSNAEVTSLTVIDTEKVVSALQYLAPTPQASTLVALAESVTNEAAAMANKKDVKVKTEIRTGDPANVINGMSGDYDLIIMGTRGLHGLPHLLLGSVAEKVAREAKCPVMVVKDRGIVDGRAIQDISNSKTALKGNEQGSSNNKGV